MAERSPRLAELFKQLLIRNESAKILQIGQVQEQGPPRFYCWKRGAHPDTPVPTLVESDATSASEVFIELIRASTPWPRYVKQADGSYAPESLIPETRVCIDRDDKEYLVGEVDWLDGDMRHGELWKWFGPEEKAAFQKFWAAMKRGPNEEWF